MAHGRLASIAYIDLRVIDVKDSGAIAQAGSVRPGCLREVARIS